MFRIFLHIFIVFVIFLAQIFISAMPGNLNTANLVLISLVFFLVFDDLKALTYWILGLGVLIELVSYLPFGANMIGLAGSVVLSYLIMKSWLTNRSLYSLLILTAVATFSNNLIMWSYSFVFGILNDQAFIIEQQLIGPRFIWSLALNSVIMIALFYILNFINPRLKPFLLLRHR